MVAPHFATPPLHTPPPPSPTSARPGEPLRSIAGWATAAKVTVGLTMAASVGTAGTAFGLARSWTGFDNGTTTFAELVDAENLYGVAFLAYFVVQLAAWVCVITWLYRAAKNAEVINPARMNNTPKWAIWGWFVPFMNWVRPYHMVKETWEASDRGNPTPAPITLFKTWWGLILASGVVFQFTSFTSNLDSIATNALHRGLRRRRIRRGRCCLHQDHRLDHRTPGQRFGVAIRSAATRHAELRLARG